MTQRILGLLAVLALGGVVGLVGVLAHRAYPWFGLVAVLVLTLVAAVFVRAWSSWPALGVFTAGLAIAVSVFAQEGPGGGLLLVEDALGWTYLVGAAGAVVLAAVIPAKVLVGSHDVA
ncbi:hypothetical protein [Demequina sp. NBRC 110052]|uniref:hypothetical protein n=1 Tax=Demequina sp. NBRC 110052 TaxID=1570341 RepID=UPI000A038A90|nr:hypothetical protein [Demequina sp. NBRC 110052]